MATAPEHRGWLRRLMTYCLRHRVWLGLAFGTALLGALISAAVPLVIRHVVDDVLAPGSKHTGIGPWVGLLIVFAVLQYAITFGRRYSAGKLSLDVQYDLRADVFGALLRLDGEKQDEIDTGQVVSRSITDIGLVQGLLAFTPLLASNALLFVVSLVVMVFLSPILTLIALAVAPALWFVASRSRRDLFPANWDAQQQSGEVVGQVEAAVTGVRVVKGFGQENRELTDLEGRARTLFASRMRVVRMQSKYSPALQAIPALGQVGVLLLGGFLALNGHITLGTFLAFSTYLGQLVGPVRQLTALLTIGQQARAGVERVLDIVDASPTITDPPKPVPLPDGPLEVRFDDVAFCYANSRPVLGGVDLTIRAGETMAVVGGAGSGKSTIALLIPRLYDTDRGTVSIGGIDVRDLSLDDLRSRLGVVFEESFLFSDTIRANLSYGRPTASDGEIRAAAAAAQADGFIEALPDGYDTVIGERGMTLSGGQRQRVALARALLTDPSVLILDDATSAVDPRVEAEIVHTLRQVTRSRTTLLIAHRRSSLDLADRVAVLDGGRVVDIGTVEELEQRSTLFRSLFTVSTDLDVDLADLPTRITAITPELWQRPEPVDGTLAAEANLQRAVASAGGAGQQYGAMFGAVPASPELLARVDALPPARDVPKIPDSLSHAADPHFGLRSLIRPVRRVLSLGLLLVGLDAVAQLAVPALVRTGIDRGVTAQSRNTLLLVSVIALGILVVDWVINWAGQRITGRTGERLLYLLRVKTFAHLQRLGLDYYERELGGRIMTRMTTDVDALSNFLQTGLTTTLVSLLTLVGVLIALIILDAQLSLVLVIMLPVLIAATWYFRRRTVPAYIDAREKVSVVNAQLQENVAGLRVTQVYGRAERNQTDYLLSSEVYRDSRLRAQRYISIYFPFVQFLSDLAGALVLGIGAARLRDGSLSPGALIAYFLYLDAFFSPVQQLSQVFDGYQQSSVGLARLRDLLRTPTSTPAAADPSPLADLRGGIELRDVHFAYDGARSEAVSGLDLIVKPGETVALVGETGAGKSSVVKLIARFYDPTRGAVLADGRDLRDLDLAEYRHRLGIVPQEAYLSPGSLRDAIAYGRPEASDLEVEAAARAVGAHEMVAGLTNGYLHEVGERGHNLSAGQRQLVALARAELVDPDILLLDEATASLDLASEAAVTAATSALTRARTTIVVAHRLTTAARADRIVVLDQGRIVEVGQHDDLVAAGGTYASLWAAYTAGSGAWVF
ncbi:MAG: transporter [Pseudonocardiales bacterium]|nr:transporter [Pseudonocardiales bacterium]